MEKQICLDWIDFYMELADKLLPYKNDRKNLIDKIKRIYSNINIHLPKLETDNNIVDIDPFTIFGLFNKGIKTVNRIAILQGFAQEFSIKAAIPSSFEGVPVLNNMAATFYHFIGVRQENDIENLWKMFIAALKYADTQSDSNKKEFIEIYDIVSQQKGVRWNLTMALYWIRPYKYINLDSRNRWYISDYDNMPVEYIEDIRDFENVPTGEEYLDIIDKTSTVLEKNNYQYKNFPELSHYAWVVSEKVNKEIRIEEMEQARINTDDAIGDKDIQTTHYWIYSPGNNACMWNDFYTEGIMAIGWGEIGDLSTFPTKDAMKQKMKECFDPTLSYINAAHATWQFANEMKPGDIIFVKKGPFYNFCKKAELDLENDYYFIIDEINRGNLSKIFGELFMLIENDKRGVALQLLYSDEKFSVPKNLYIIGMMNTADRSLAMLDYALRRRFAFFEFSPAFRTDGFRQYLQNKNNKKFNNLITVIEKLNIAIENDESLGRGFCVGHSYFCTDKPIDDMWLNGVITYEIIPLLNEYWFDEPNKVRDWEYRLYEAIR